MQSLAPDIPTRLSPYVRNAWISNKLKRRSVRGPSEEFENLKQGGIYGTRPKLAARCFGADSPGSGYQDSGSRMAFSSQPTRVAPWKVELLPLLEPEARVSGFLAPFNLLGRLALRRRMGMAFATDGVYVGDGGVACGFYGASLMLEVIC